MSFDLNALLNQIGRDKGINKEVLIEAVESAMLSAARKHYGHNLNLEAKYEEETGLIEVYQFRTVAEKVEDEETQISVAEARQDDAEAMVGDEVGKKLDTTPLGRIAAQTAKQVIIQKFRDAERGVIYEEFKDSKGELINGIVQRYDRGNVIVNLGRAEAILPKREQIQKERYRQGDRVRGMILDIDRSARGPQIVLTRSHPDFLKKLFALEVPEIAEGIIEIKAVAREPGERAKIAVHSNVPGLDPSGSCIGVRGSRVKTVVEELRGEKIDIIAWTPDEPSFVAKALSPAEVQGVSVDDDEHSMEVIVPDDQLSLAIGRRGQNVKLASKLTGWRIDVRSVSIVEEESKRARKSLEAIPDIEFTHAEILFQHGFRSAREVSEATIEEICEAGDITTETAEHILQKAKAHVDAGGDDNNSTEGEGDSAGSDLDKLMLTPETRQRLIDAGLKTIQSVVEADIERLLAIEGIGEPQLDEIRKATDSFLNVRIGGDRIGGSMFRPAGS